MLTSTNALVVIIATPIITTFAGRIIDVRKILIGESLIILGLSGYRFVQGIMPLYFVLMVIFTVGEVFNTLGNQPYMTRRMPSTHWGRVNSFIYTVSGAFSVATIVLAVTLNIMDKKQFYLLYEKKEGKAEG